MKKTNDALKIIKRMMKSDPELQAMVRESSINAQLSQIIYDARKQAGLTQQQLAAKVGTSQ
ncbi:helix-turn-helix domain-containing protein [Nostoc sp.]|uniref:helix-turn-helix domain-containing protein n=1 Tax=Nostoc sp. TaxID=1180 RepID=UPI002FF7352C